MALSNCFHVFRSYFGPHQYSSRGLWTWTPWVIYASALNHKIGNAAHSGASEVLFYTKSYKWKKQRWKKWTTWILLRETMWFWRSPTVRLFRMADRQIRSQQKLQLLDVAWKLPVYSLLFPCSISFAESFVTCLRNKVHVFLLSYLLSSESYILYMNKTQVYSKKRGMVDTS